LSQDYKDYFIKDGRHIGDYEGMYRNCPDPWNIEALGLRLDMLAALLLLDFLKGPIAKVLDLGCGAGLFSLEVIRKLSKDNKDIWFLLSDISPTALRQAEKRLRTSDLGERGRKEALGKAGAPPLGEAPPDLASLYAPEADFLPLDLRTLPKDNPFSGKGFDLVVLAQALWGILEDLEAILTEVRKSLSPKGALLISQHFPGDAQEYGRDIVRDPEGLKGFLRKAGFKESHSVECDRDFNHHYGGLWRSS
jgi:SAM-dependent methyltransferase